MGEKLPVVSETEKQKILQQLLNSPDFRDSKRYQDLLKYLVEKSAVTDSIKEVEIAHDIFGKDASFDPGTDPLIRSYISNLRKKLEHYYLTTPNQFDYRIEIPKGQYTVNYVEVNKKAEVQKTAGISSFIYIPVIIILATVIIYQNLFTAKTITPSGNAPNYLWNDFEKNSTIIVFGDYFFFSDREKPGERIFLRNIKINSHKEFEDSARKNPALKNRYEPLEFTFLRPSATAALPEIIKILGCSPEKVTLKLASQLKWEDFNNHNIIYVGTFKTLYILDTLLAKTNIRYSSNPSALTILDKKENKQQTFPLEWRNGSYQNDYSLVLKLYGSKDNVILFLMGFSEIGTMHAIKASVDRNLNSLLEKTKGAAGNKPFKFFEMISLTEGVDQTVFRSELKHINYSPDIFD